MFSKWYILTLFCGTFSCLNYYLILMCYFGQRIFSFEYRETSQIWINWGWSLFIFLFVWISRKMYWNTEGVANEVKIATVLRACAKNRTPIRSPFKDAPSPLGSHGILLSICLLSRRFRSLSLSCFHLYAFVFVMSYCYLLLLLNK